MKHMMTVALALLMTGTLMVAQNARSPEVLFKAAQHAEQVQGDLQAAIEQYKKVVAAGSRALAAQALVRMAECYEKLGDVESKKIYEQLVRDYTDQKDAVILARTRLGRAEGADVPRAMALRKVWGNETPEIAGAHGQTQYAISADGRYMTYVGNYNTALVLRDLTSGADRRLTSGGYPGPSPWGGIYQSAISHDNAQVAFNSNTENQTICEIRVASMKGTGVPVSRRLFGGDDIQYIAPMDWSPDGKWLAVSLKRKDRTAQIGLLALSDGALRVLKSVDWRGTTRMFFSPDGLDIAFDLPVNETGTERDVFVLAADGSREVAAVAYPGNDIVIGWTPDGAHLLFASDRGGAMGLWGQAFRDRKPQGAPELVKPDIGNVSPLGITRSGALYLGVRATNEDIELASIDLTTGKQTAPPVKPIQRFTGDNSQPTWSPDGKSLAFVSARGEKDVVAIRSMETGDIRELKVPGLQYFGALSWAPDGDSFAVRGQDLKGRVGVFRIEARRGDVVPIVLRSSAEFLTYEGFFWSPDARRMYYHGNLGSIFELDLTSGNERSLVSGPATDDGPMGPIARMGPISLSPDGRWIAAYRSDPSTKSQTVVLIPVNGGEPRELLRVSEPERIGNRSMPWAPDGRGILIKKETSAGTELWFIPISGEPARKIDLDARAFGTIRLHPDGKQIAFDSRRFSTEVWVLENFLPALKASR